MKKAYRIFSNISVIKPCKSAVIVSVILTVLFLFPISAAADEFPAGGTFNGMQITYSISGVSIESSTDVEDFTTSRKLTGTVTGNTVTLTATVKQENGFSADFSAGCGDKTYSKSIEVGQSDTFTLTAAVTKDMEYINVSVSMTGNYNAGTRGLVVSGTFKNANYAGGTSETNTSTTTPKSNNTSSNKNTVSKNPNLEDAGCIFSDLAGQVEVLNPIGYKDDGTPDYGDEEDWHFAKIDEPLYVGTKIKTGLDSNGNDSMAIISFADMSTFVLQESTTIELVSPIKKESKIKLAAGNIWANVKKMVKDGTMDVEMSQAVAGIKGTIFVCEVKEDGTSTLKVIEGEVKFTDKATGTATSVTGGKMIAAGAQAVPLSDFDIKAEHKNWLKYDPDLAISNKSNATTIIIIVIILVVLIGGVLAIYIVNKKRRVPANMPYGAAPAGAPLPNEPMTQSVQPAEPQRKFCAGCGAPVKPGTKFCGGCGGKL